VEFDEQRAAMLPQLQLLSSAKGDAESSA